MTFAVVQELSRLLAMPQAHACSLPKEEWLWRTLTVFTRYCRTPSYIRHTRVSQVVHGHVDTLLRITYKSVPKNLLLTSAVGQGISYSICREICLMSELMFQKVTSMLLKKNTATEESLFKVIAI